MNEIIKEVRIEEEKELVKKFLLDCGLLYENDIDKTLYIDDDKGHLLATISSFKNTIKCLAVSKDYQGDNYASLLISEIVNRFYLEKIYNYKVYTKIIYENLFLSLGFKKIVSTNNVCILEGGIGGIETEINKIKKQVELKFEIKLEEEKINAVVVNCNPMTIGHLSLIEEASMNSNYTICFVLEEEKSMFSFKERFSLVYLGVMHLRNVIVIPSTEYIISSLTFPTYFLKEKSLANKEWMLTDALIFKDYFMKELNILNRYVGMENDEVMKMYNETLKEVLGIHLIEIKRFKGISASNVRRLISEGKTEEAMNFIPIQCRSVLKSIIVGKNING